MAGWSGFTDEELSKLKDSNLSVQNVKKDRKTRQKENVLKAASRPLAKRAVPNQQTSGIKEENENVESNGNHNQMTESADSGMKTNEQNDKTIGGKDDPNDMSDSKRMKKNENEQQKEKIEILVKEKEETTEIKLLTETDELNIKMSQLEKLQKKQKEIEEENKMKRKMIKDTISQRYKKAKAEASTLQNVQKELSHLDHLLANDVEILRHKIEEATLSYSHAQKRYEKAEKEFVSAKLELQLKSDTKDQLTQHLYTIIQENELRKAKKLEELMSKLNMEENVIHDSNEQSNVVNTDGINPVESHETKT